MLNPRGAGVPGAAWATLVLIATLFAACSGHSATKPSQPAVSSATIQPSPAPPSGTGFPGADWEKVDPAAAGLDAAKLKDIAATAEAGNSNCLLVVRGGKIAGEWYFRGTNENSAQQVFSATKSFSSTLVGIAQDDGKLKTADSASKWITDWKGTPSEAVTVRDLLSNDSGREWSLRSDYVGLAGAVDRTAYAIGLGQAQAPGTVWAYNNSAIQTLQRVLQVALGEDVTTFAQDRIFKPLGMSHTTMMPDRAGNAQTFSGIQSTCRDMARFGWLILNQGQWAGKQIVSTAWVAEATGKPSTNLVANYGYLWWLNREGVLANPIVATDPTAPTGPALSGRVAPGAPDDMFWAIGAGNQIIQIDPGSKTVVVRLGTAAPRPQPPTFGPAEASKVVTEALTKK